MQSVGKKHRKNLMMRLERMGVKKIDRTIDLPAVYEKFAGECQNCHCQTVMGIHPTVGESASIEHIKPLSRGGNHVWSNITLLCSSCNQSVNQQKQSAEAKAHSYKFNFFGFEFSFKLWK